MMMRKDLNFGAKFFGRRKPFGCRMQELIDSVAELERRAVAAEARAAAWEAKAQEQPAIDAANATERMAHAEVLFRAATEYMSRAEHMQREARERIVAAETRVALSEAAAAVREQDLQSEVDALRALMARELDARDTDLQVLRATLRDVASTNQEMLAVQEGGLTGGA